jgi:hypothetical protein
MLLKYVFLSVLCVFAGDGVVIPKYVGSFIDFVTLYFNILYELVVTHVL